MSVTSRAEHVAWAKQRALEYCDSGCLAIALQSLTSDLLSHPKTETHAAIELGTMMTMAGLLSTAKQMCEFIDGIN